MNACAHTLLCHFQVKSTDPGSNNCKREFDYASTRKGPGMMLPIVMEAALCNQRTWAGPVGMELGKRMYANCCTEGSEDIDAIMRELAAMGVTSGGAGAGVAP